MNKKVSFDYDDTLSRKDVQEMAKKLITAGVEVWVCTFRFDNVNAKEYIPPHIYKYRVDTLGEFNGDLFKVADELGIKQEHIHFTNYVDKDEFFLKNPDFEWHLDDQWDQLKVIMENTSVKAINVEYDGWEEECLKII